MAVTVEPSTFEYVEYDAGEIADLVGALATAIGLGDVDVHVEIDETVPLGRNRLESIDPITIWLESGALEDPKRIRQFSTAGATDVLGRPGTWRRIHVLDGAVFPDVPATTFTLTVMANAHRIATQTVESAR